MAHGYVSAMLPEAHVYSAGVETHGVNPRAILYMKEDGIDISNHTSNHVDEYKDINFDIALTVCDHANEVCPVIHNTEKRIHHNFSDPSKLNGTSEEIADAFRKTRNEIKAYISTKIEEGVFK